ncbi:hypothetical protein ABIB90_006213 [Bradyrhizobium sp. JR4.1]
MPKHTEFRYKAIRRSVILQAFRDPFLNLYSSSFKPIND